MKCEKCKIRNAHLVVDVVEDDPSQGIYVYEDEDYESDGLVSRTMNLCRQCAQEAQGVTMVKKKGRK